jgi:transcriptional regulator with XRE-family HTH domain
MPNRPRRTVKFEHLPAKLLAVRKNLSLSQSQLTARLRITPHYGRISEYERAKRTPSILTLLDYSNLAKITINDLVDDEIDLTRFRDELLMEKIESR